jgi:ABC-type multidrug transport system fused ATPase/permease subunit
MEQKKIREYLKEAFRKPEAVSRFRYGDVLFFFRFARPAWKTGLVGLVLTVITSALGSLLPLGSKVLIDFVITKEGFRRLDDFLISHNLGSLLPHLKNLLGSVNLVVLMIFAIGLCAGLTGLVRRYLVFRFQQEFIFSLQKTLFDYLLRFPVSFFKKKQTGYLMSRVSDDLHTFQILFSESVAEIAARLLYFLFGLAIVSVLSLKLTLILLGVLPVYAFINYFFANRLRSSSLEERETQANVSRDIQEVISGVETVKAFRAEDTQMRKVSQRMGIAMSARIKSMVISLFSNYAVGGVQFASTLIIMWFGINEVLKGSMTIGDYVAFTAYMVVLASSMNTLFMFHIMLQPAFASMERLSEIFGMISETKEEEVAGKMITPGEISGEIRFENVSFSYEEGRPVLRDINFSAFPGEIICLVGRSGAGKTTLVNLLLKFYHPESGSIFLDGHNLEEISTSWLRDRTAVVSQDIFLFDDTIANNIRYGNPMASDDELIHAAMMADIHNYISSLSAGYKTVIGEKGTRLSAGQRQRISIARAFLRNPSILIFDEPTSALDPQSEYLLKDSITRLAAGKTTFIIAHRLSLAEISHRLLVLDNGRLAETGTHRELINKNGFYCAMFASAGD